MIFNIIIGIFTLAGSIAEADHWNYDDVSEWPGFCKTGTQQSPIDLLTSKTTGKIYSAFQFTNYDTYNEASITNNGHSVAIYLDTDNDNIPTISGGGLVGDYVLDHFHFHWESEHTVDGYRYPLEMHLVHYSVRYGNLSEASEYASGVAVLGVLFDLSIDNDEDFIPLIEVMEKVDKFPNREAALDRSISAKSFLPRNTADYYRYTGSLTTPTCNEGVIWTVFSKTLPISADQVEHFEAVWSEEGALTSNYRPIQPLNDRVISFRNSPSRRTGSSSTISATYITILAFLILSFIQHLGLQ